MTLSARLNHPRADVRIQARNQMKMNGLLLEFVGSRKIHGGGLANANIEQLTLQIERKAV
jgi:hypothetical protein